MWLVRFHPEANKERDAVPPRERNALDRAADKLALLGPALPFPHSSAVRGAPQLRELRPRAGHSPWRALYARVGDVFLIFAVGPEAQADPRGFDRSVVDAVRRLQETPR